MATALMLAGPAWAYRQQVVLCRDGDGWRAVDAARTNTQAMGECAPFDPVALHRRAKRGDADAVAALLTVVATTRLLPNDRVRAAKAIDWPAGVRPPQPLLRRAVALFAAPRTPFRAAVALGGFLDAQPTLPPVAPEWLSGLERRLLKAETCPVAARLLSHTSLDARQRMIDAWTHAQHSDEVTACIEREIGPHAAELVDTLLATARRVSDPITRMRLVNWLALAGRAAQPALAALADDPDPRVRRLVHAYLDAAH